MAKFAKVIDIDEDTQVLIFIEYNSKTDKNDVIILTDIEGSQAKLTFEFDNQEEAYKGLNDFTNEKAHDFINSVKRNLIGD
ncbi:hypothetical protein [Myroides odoratimimus]|uniref:hypothetical protein n=1 Tax=Myroides odoratimimus TaxID=76832 RepID=UPI0025790950|nr:hypothetical protein [Myroides odoratimimus]MDM1536377.1 hypothetical protein [Myroides odoratimimus]MDM1676041.1 hypothetical protein [Myroides odoratimimus]